MNRQASMSAANDHPDQYQVGIPHYYTSDMSEQFSLQYYGFQQSSNMIAPSVSYMNSFGTSLAR
jgi:hypothetical protein